MMFIALCWVITGCSDETFYSENEEGTGYLRLALGSIDVELSSTSRAETVSLPDDLIPQTADFMIDIRQGNSSVEGFPKKYSELADEGIELMAGGYTVTAYCGENEPIQDTPYFSGSATVQIRPNEPVTASINAALANAMLTPAVSESLQNHYSAWTLTVKSGESSMKLADNEKADGYLFAQVGQPVNAVFEGTNILGHESSHEWAVISSAAAQTKYVIQCDPDLSVFSNIQLTATATHTYAEGTLTGTDVALNLAANGAPLELVDDWDIQLLYNGSTIRTYSSQPQNNAIMAVTDGWPYVPQGSTLFAYIHLQTGETVELTSAVLEEIPQPEFTATVSGSTSYSVYLDPNQGAEVANTKDGSSIFDINATATIAPEISSNPNYSDILKVTYKTDSGQSSGELPFGTASELNSLAWQKHALTATVSFDRVEITSSPVECDVTGLPYRAEPPRNTGNNPWRIIQNGTINYIEFNDTYVLLKSDGTHPIIGSSPFYIPKNINFKLQSKYKKNSHFLGDRDKYEYEVNLLSGNTVGERICINDAKEPQEYIVEGHKTFTSTINAISCRFETKSLFGVTANLIYVYIDYE